MFNLKALNKLLFQIITSISIITLYFYMIYNLIQLKYDFILVLSFHFFQLTHLIFRWCRWFCSSNVFFILIIFYFFQNYLWKNTLS